MTHKILLIDENELSRTGIKRMLHWGGYQFVEAGNIDEAYVAAGKGFYDLILLNWSSSSSRYINFIKRLKNDELMKDSRLLLLTTKDVEEMTVQGLKAGADDYLVKPISEKVLTTRIRAWLSADVQRPDRKNLSFDSISLDENSHLVTISGQFLQLGPTEFRLLRFFMKHPNQAFRRGELITKVWNDLDMDQRTVDVHIRRLRKVLEPHGYDRYIQTIRTIGYRFSSIGITARENIIEA